MFRDKKHLGGVAIAVLLALLFAVEAGAHPTSITKPSRSPHPARTLPPPTSITKPSRSRRPARTLPPHLHGFVRLDDRGDATALVSTHFTHLLRNPLTSAGGFAHRLEKRSPEGSSTAAAAAVIVQSARQLERMVDEQSQRLSAAPNPRRALRQAYANLARGELARGTHQLLQQAAHLQSISRESGADQRISEAVFNAAHRLQGLSHELAALRRYQKVRIPQHPIPLEPLLQTAATQVLQHKAAQNKVRLRFDLAPDARVARLDQPKFTAAIQEFLANSVAAMPQGGTIQIQTRRVGRALHLTINDHGAGINPEHLPLLGQPLVGLTAEGQGLGLARARAVIEAHKGAVYLNSRQDRGTTVLVRLPR